MTKEIRIKLQVYGNMHLWGVVTNKKILGIVDMKSYPLEGPLAGQMQISDNHHHHFFEVTLAEQHPPDPDFLREAAGGGKNCVIL